MAKNHAIKCELEPSIESCGSLAYLVQSTTKHLQADPITFKEGEKTCIEVANWAKNLNADMKCGIGAPLFTDMIHYCKVKR